ncbi:MAG: hypothetical protein WBG92_13015 [Thiohalocapsa sp.]
MLIWENSIERLVRDANEIGKLNPEQLGEAQRLAATCFSDKASFMNRMRLVLLLVHPGAAPPQGDRGIELLGGALATESGATASEKAFAGFVYSFIVNHVDQESTELESTRQLNSGLKRRQNQLRGQLQKAQNALREERQERQSTEQQLDAELKRHQDQLRDQLQKAQNALWEERRKRRTLEQQLEALKQLEETINERESPDEESSQ